MRRHLPFFGGGRGAALGINTALHVIMLVKNQHGKLWLWSTNLMAASKTFLRPFWVNAEHSRYLGTRVSNENVLVLTGMSFLLYRLDLLCACHSLRVRDRWHSLFTKLGDCLLIITEIELSADKDDWNAWSMVRDFRVPLIGAVSTAIISYSLLRCIPLIGRCQTTVGSRSRSTPKRHLSEDKKGASNDRNLLDQRYPKGRDWLVCHQPWHLQSSCQSYNPVMRLMSALHSKHAFLFWSNSILSGLILRIALAGEKGGGVKVGRAIMWGFEIWREEFKKERRN